MNYLFLDIPLGFVILITGIVILTVRCIYLENKKREIASHALDIGVKHLSLLTGIKDTMLQSEESVQSWEQAITVTMSYVVYMKKELK